MAYMLARALHVLAILDKHLLEASAHSLIQGRIVALEITYFEGFVVVLALGAVFVIAVFLQHLHTGVDACSMWCSTPVRKQSESNGFIVCFCNPVAPPLVFLREDVLLFLCALAAHCLQDISIVELFACPLWATTFRGTRDICTITRRLCCTLQPLCEQLTIDISPTKFDSPI